MKTLKFLTVLLITSLSFNCSKNDDSLTVLPPNEQPENIRVKTYGQNSSERHFSYNTNNMLSSYQDDAGTTQSIVYNTENNIIANGPFSYSYNSQGQISNMMEAPTTGYSNKGASFVYNNMGQIVSCSFHFDHSGTTTYLTRTFEYNSNNQLISVTENENGEPNSNRQLITYDSHGNIALIEEQSSPDSTNYTTGTTTSYTYDDKKNPSYNLLTKTGTTSNFSLVRVNAGSLINFGNYVFFRLYFYSPNNIISRQVVYSTGNDHYTYDYVYNDEGFPTAGEITDGSNTGYYNWTYETY